ncbi:MAG: chemotaxis response regulator protein-glutamate methylesterase [Verrucomicrobiota bacterium]
MAKIRVLIVDDSVVIRRMISKVIEADPQLEVAGIAANGKIALQKISNLNPDIITLDIEMPILDGISTVREIRKTHSAIPIIMFSTLSTKGAASTLEALSAGATDYVTKPANVGNVTEGIAALQSELVPKIKAHFPQKPAAPAPIQKVSKPITRPVDPPKVSQPLAFCIGSSTGGPNALSDLFESIDYLIPVPTFIVQHMPPVFTKMLADRLDKVSPNRFHEAYEGQIAEAGNVYIAPGGKHMEVVRIDGQVKTHLTDAPPENSCRPAVDVLFRSIASTYGPAALATILTGMGADGTRGSQAIRDQGGQILVQDEASCVVWGMPRSVTEAGLADKVLPLKEIPQEITQRFKVKQALSK